MRMLGTSGSFLGSSVASTLTSITSCLRRRVTLMITRLHMSGYDVGYTSDISIVIARHMDNVSTVRYYHR